MSFFKLQPNKKQQELIENTCKHADWSSQFYNHHTQDLFSPRKALRIGITATVVSLLVSNLRPLHSLDSRLILFIQTALAYDPVQSFLAVGTSDGHLHLYGSPAVASVSWQNQPAHSIKFLAFKSGSPLICAIGVSQPISK
jgi:hypothetical protein